MSSIAIVAGAYLLGSISWSLLIVRALLGRDVRRLGSGNAGASNVLRVAGALPALAVLVLDVAKGVVAVQAARWLEAPGPVIVSAAVAVVAGHVFPIFHGLRGGKGVATASGALGSLAPLPALGAILIFSAAVAATRYVAIGSIAAAASFPALLAASGAGGLIELPRWLMAASIAACALVVAKHSENVIRLRDGTEAKLGQRDDEPAAATPGEDGR